MKREIANSHDSSDKLKRFRERFFHHNVHTIYLDGNSLGRMPICTREKLLQVLDEEWGSNLIESWNAGWYDLAGRTGNKLGTLLGAKNGEIIISDTTSLNLYKVLYGILKSDPSKTEIISDTLNFPSDLYIIQGLIDQFGAKYRMSLAKSLNEITINTSEIVKKINRNTAALVLSHVTYKSGFKYDLKKITALARHYGVKVIWDLSHSVGVVPINLEEEEIDFAIGCTYKYLNSGPGAPAFLYIRDELKSAINSPIYGWFSAKDPFNFSLNYEPATSIKKFLTGTPPILSLSAVESGVDIILEAGIENIRQKSIEQTSYLIDLVRDNLDQYGFEIATPLNPDIRGSHISLKYPKARQLCLALMDVSLTGKKILTDFREPDNIRFGISPLYNSFLELNDTIYSIKHIIENINLGLYNEKTGPVT